jgi:hypothetical protein
LTCALSYKRKEFEASAERRSLLAPLLSLGGLGVIVSVLTVLEVAEALQPALSIGAGDEGSAAAFEDAKATVDDFDIEAATRDGVAFAELFDAIDFYFHRFSPLVTKNPPASCVAGYRGSFDQ